jgi:hypothetical protein
MASQIRGQEHYAGFSPVVISPWFLAGSKLYITPLSAG